MTPPAPGANSIAPLPALFDALDDDARANATARCERRRLRAGDILLTQGDRVDHLYIVEEGTLLSEVADGHGPPMAVGTMGVGDCCGEMSFLRGDNAATTVKAVTRTTVLCVPQSLLRELTDRYPPVMKELGSALARKLSQANLRIRRAGTGRLVAVAGVDSDWAAALLRCVAASAARHLRDHVVVVNLTGLPLAGAAIRPLGGLESILADHAKGAADPRAEAGVSVIDGTPLQVKESEMSALLDALRQQYGLTILAVAEPAPAPSLSGLQGELDAPLLQLRPDTDPRSGRTAGGMQAPQTVLLRRSLSPALPAALRTLSHQYGADLLRVVPGDIAHLQNPPGHFAPGEPWASVDWVARHLLGRKVGLALGAGGAKGYAHLGVYDQLIRMGVPIDYVAGCSIGAPVAASIARHTPIADTKRALDEVFQKALRPTLPISSFLSSRRLRGRLDKIIGGQTFEELGLPLAIVAADMERKTEVVFREGSLLTAVMASMAIPGIFPSVEVNGRPLVDGAILNPIPNATLRAMGADVVIGVRLTGTSVTREERPRAQRFFRSPPIVDTIASAFEVMQWKLAADTAARSDITIEPRFEGRTGLHDFTRGEEFIENGRGAAESGRVELRALLPWVD